MAKEKSKPIGLFKYFEENSQMGDEDMCQALMEIMKPEIEEALSYIK